MKIEKALREEVKYCTSPEGFCNEDREEKKWCGGCCHYDECSTRQALAALLSGEEIPVDRERLDEILPGLCPVASDIDWEPPGGCICGCAGPIEETVKECWKAYLRKDEE